jgi:hypothetical protein
MAETVHDPDENEIAAALEQHLVSAHPLTPCRANEKG